MNKTELIDKVAKKTGLTLKDSRGVVEAIFSTSLKDGILAGELAAGRKVQITGFGTFMTRRRKKRMGRNPQTGEAIKIPAKRVLKFRIAKAMKEAALK
jgi:DNA-binding protein HU-beta